jgi:hypothetical protein
LAGEVQWFSVERLHRRRQSPLVAARRECCSLVTVVPCVIRLAHHVHHVNSTVEPNEIDSFNGKLKAIAFV